MTHQVLARKWRPKKFAEVVGQEHVTTALANALTQLRLHHAYLFTGTRGVGKTTLARILAKCLNCEEGITATPCGKCRSCQEIEQGRFVDLIEVDAASRTKVEDTRELLDNVQYTPNYGRYKIYLIDEVHMLSGHSFNALLKTLEEPPEHVKFLFATTDPQKLPVTILSRCLQFNLKLIDPEHISGHLENVLKQEKVEFEAAALAKLALAAKGSIRDGLSLLDQAIGYSNGKITTAIINQMLAIASSDQLYILLKAITNKEIESIFNIINKLYEHSIDFYNVLSELISILHHLALLQMNPKLHQAEWGELTTLQELAQLFSAEQLQLYYQIALIGQRDLPLAPTPKIGFEMTILRMIAFHPVSGGLTETATTGAHIGAPLQKQLNSHENKSKPTNDWQQILSQLKLSGSTKALASNCSLNRLEDNFAELLLNARHAPMLHSKHAERLSTAFSEYFAKPIKVEVTIIKETVETPQTIYSREQNIKQQQAQQQITSDGNILELQSRFGATIIPGSINSKQK